MLHACQERRLLHTTSRRRTPFLMSFFRRFLPDAEAVRNNRWLRWLGPALHHPRLWHVSRRGLALGMALGFFFGLLIPVAQIPLSAAAAVALRANVPAAVASTLVTNPVTFGPVYYLAWRLGSAILGEPVREGQVPPAIDAQAQHTAGSPPTAQARDDERWWQSIHRRILGVGKPLIVGLAVMATAVGIFTYFAVSWLWALKVWWTRRRRLQTSAGRRSP